MAPSIAAAILAWIALPSLCSAGWRSADRWPLDRDEPVAEEPCPNDGAGDTQWQGGPSNEIDAEWHGHVRGRARHRADMVPQATQPYWGTMRPYWNSPEPPGVIHRQPRTAPLKIQRER